MTSSYPQVPHERVFLSDEFKQVSAPAAWRYFFYRVPVFFQHTNETFHINDSLQLHRVVGLFFGRSITTVPNVPYFVRKKDLPTLLEALIDE